MRKNKVDVITLGCSKNLVDSEQLLRLFSASGYQVAHDPHQVNGEIVVINTCGFIEAARQESIDMILNVIEAKKKGRIGKVFVMGCLSERYLDELKTELPEVDGFYGKFNWRELVQSLGKAFHTLPSDIRYLTTPSHYAYVKISEGCNRSCSYCSIPIMTGKHKSRSLEEIKSEVCGLAQAGVKEIQLIAQDLTYYGRDIYHKALLPELVESLCEIKGIEWIRLHYAYPYEFPYDICRVIKENPKVCKYLDIALQHISDPMLKAMRRHVTKKDTYDLIHHLRREIPNLYLRTTFMVGHPGESEQDFGELCDFIEEIKFERMGAFMYSHEEGTYGYTHYNDDIPIDVKQDRLDILMEKQQRIAFQVAEEEIGKKYRVIIDREDPDYYIGRTEHDSPDVDPEVMIPRGNNSDLQIGSFYTVQITDNIDYDLLGNVVE